MFMHPHLFVEYRFAVFSLLIQKVETGFNFSLLEVASHVTFCLQKYFPKLALCTVHFVYFASDGYYITTSPFSLLTFRANFFFNERIFLLRSVTLPVSSGIAMFSCFFLNTAPAFIDTGESDAFARALTRSFPSARHFGHVLSRSHWGRISHPDNSSTL